MKTVWIAGIALLATTSVHAQSTIYKHVDEGGRITYSNKPMKGAQVLELEPLTVIPGTPGPAPTAKAAVEKASFTLPAATVATIVPAEAKSDLRPIAAIVTPLPRTTLASIEPQVQKKRDGDRRRILEEELSREEQSFTTVRASIAQEQLNPDLVAAVRAAQQATDPTPTQLALFRENLDKASGRIRGLQATSAEHEKNIEALKKELGSLKP